MTAVKTGDLMVALRKHLAAPEWALFEQVSNGTGYGGGKAYADVVAMSLWPSRGLQLHGMEVKVSRSDWQRERAKPSKAEIIAQYCDFWWLVTGPGIVHDEGEVPPAWGWKVWDGKKWQTKRQPTQTEARPMDRSFLAALLRRAGECGEGVIKAAVNTQLAGERESMNRQINDEFERANRRHKDLADQVRAFEEASGLKITGYEGGIDVARAVKVVQTVGVGATYSAARSAAAHLRRVADSVEIAVADLEKAMGQTQEGAAA